MRYSAYGLGLLMVAASCFAADPVDEANVKQALTDVRTTQTPSLTSYENEILITQSGGMGNFAMTEQFGNVQSKITVEQNGNNNVVGVIQANGMLNRADVTQFGSSNYTQVSQIDSNNIANISQTNDFNRFVLNQSGGSNTANVSQLGNSSMTFNQTGGQTANIILQSTAQGTITQNSPTLNLTVTPTP